MASVVVVVVVVVVVGGGGGVVGVGVGIVMDGVLVVWAIVGVVVHGSCDESGVGVIGGGGGFCVVGGGGGIGSGDVWC